MLKTKVKGQTVQTHKRTDATKHIISPVSQSIKIQGWVWHATCVAPNQQKDEGFNRDTGEVELISVICRDSSVQYEVHGH